VAKGYTGDKLKEIVKERIKGCENSSREDLRQLAKELKAALASGNEETMNKLYQKSYK